MPGYRLSPSSLALFEDCPRCFYLQVVKKIKRPEAPFPSLPSGIDKVLKEHFDNYRKQNRIPIELKRHKIRAKLFDDMELLEEWRNYHKGGLQYTDKKSGVILRGFVDEILRANGKLIVLDFKTRGFPIKEGTAEYYKSQIDLYNFLLRKMGYGTEDYGYLLFFHPEKVNGDGNFIFNTELKTMEVSVRHAGNLFRSAIKVLSGKEPKPPRSCGYCNWGGALK